MSVPTVSWVGSYDPSFSRNRYLRRLLTILQADVRESPREIVPAQRHRILETSKVRLIGRAVIAAVGTFVTIVARPAPDVYFASYPGYLDLPVVRLGAWLKRRPLVFDAFVSLHDTIVSDRQLVAADGFAARTLRVFDRLLLRLPDVVIADTPEHADFYADLSGRPLERFAVVRVGADEDVFIARTDTEPVKGRVVFYGSYVPLQGVSTIVEAAGLLQRSQVSFRLIGDGQDRPAIEADVRKRGIDNIEFIEPMPLERLNDEIQRAEVVLGIFGTSDKARRVVPHKVYEACAARRPVITADTMAMQSAFRGGDLELVPPGDPVALADAIRTLIENSGRAENLAAEGQATFKERFSREALARALERAISRAVGKH